ncbi:MAG: hypothetical protein AMJ73_06770 [candidate division Zixibacteria bacterium SM1_73]|nr:MAG: hypothetical protein AMJ73_06770 [candidate division Zixibacteria bacterium SM1_73]
MSLLRPGQSSADMPDKLSKMDYYQIITSTLMVILGAIILFRSLSQNIMIMPLLVGGGLLALGLYRLNFVVKYLRIRRDRRKGPKWNPKERKWNHR